MRDLWNWVEAKAFNPRTAKDKLTWLRCFHIFVQKTWGIERDWSKPIKSGNYWCSDKIDNGRGLKLESLSLKPLRDSEIGFFYCIKIGENGFSVRLFYSRSCFQIDYDTTYLFEFRNDPNPNINMNEITKEDIAQVMKKRIHHPALHTHLKREDGGDYYHHLRFGFATNNPFVILYQVAFQIIDYQNDRSIMKEDEISRVSEIIHSNKNEIQIGAGILFPH